jgi:antitoxin MazE
MWLAETAGGECVGTVDFSAFCNYKVIMRARLVPIGNSKGIRLPRAVIEQCALEDEIELEVKKDHLVLRPVKKLRQGWEEAFKKMHKAGDDKLLDEADAHAFTPRDQKEWVW